MNARRDEAQPRKSRPQPAVREERPVRASIEVEARFTLGPIVLVSDRVVLLSMPTHVAVACLSVPVARASRYCGLKERPTEGWPRVLPGSVTSAVDDAPAAIVVSASRAWHRADSAVEIVGDGVLIDGAVRLIQARLSGTSHLPCLVVFGCSESDELRYHLQLNHREPIAAGDVGLWQQVGTNTERLVVSDQPVEVVIESDPFVVSTSLGYSPAILVRRTHQPIAQHLLLGARTLSLPLEEAREAVGTLVGLKVRLRKLGSERTSRYSIEVL